MTRTGIFNPNSKNRQCDELPSIPLTKQETLAILIETLETVLASIPAGTFEIFRDQTRKKLEIAKSELAVLQDSGNLTADQLADDYTDLKRTQEDARC
jgi:hypothetical protein